MLPAFRLTLAAGLVCLVACGRVPDAGDGASQPSAGGSPPGPAAADATPPSTAAPGTDDAARDEYVCADGTRLQARFGDHDAMLRWPGGRSMTLPRAESASKGGGDVYVGDTVSLQREGPRLQLHDGERAATDCAPATPAASTGAGDSANDMIGDAYACDAGTRLIRKDDGSFRAEIPGNAPVRLARIAGSEPPVFTGASLYLRIEGSGVAILSQGDRTNELRCASSHAPA